MAIAIETPGENEFEEGPPKKIIYLDHGGVTTSGSIISFIKLVQRKSRS
jgi:hypothetical protein